MFFLRSLFVLSCFLGLVQMVHAMEVRPPVLDVSAQPGSSTTTVFLLRNSELAPETYVFTIQGFIPAGDEGRQTFLPLTETAGLPSWLYLSHSRVTLQPGETVPIIVTFRPPTDVRAGAYQAVVFANQVDPQAGGSVTLGSRVGVLVFATVEGQVRRALSVGSFLLRGPRHVSHLPVSFEVLIRNEGEAHEVPEGRVRIRSMWGGVAALLPLSSTERPIRILPHSERRFTVSWGESTRASGFWSKLQTEWSPFAFGWYRARLILDREASAASDAEISFFVLPWRTLLLASIGLVFVGFVVRARRT